MRKSATDGFLPVILLPLSRYEQGEVNCLGVGNSAKPLNPKAVKPTMAVAAKAR